MADDYATRAEVTSEKNLTFCSGMTKRTKHPNRDAFFVLGGDELVRTVAPSPSKRFFEYAQNDKRKKHPNGCFSFLTNIFYCAILELYFILGENYGN